MKKQVIGAGLFAALWMSLGAEVQAFNQMNAAETAPRLIQRAANNPAPITCFFILISF